MAVRGLQHYSRIFTVQKWYRTKTRFGPTVAVRTCHINAVQRQCRQSGGRGRARHARCRYSYAICASGSTTDAGSAIVRGDDTDLMLNTTVVVLCFVGSTTWKRPTVLLQRARTQELWFGAGVTDDLNRMVRIGQHSSLFSRFCSFPISAKGSNA
eukprot:1768605-Rhodomonas_salina.4